MRPRLAATTQAVASAITAAVPAFATAGEPKVTRDVQAAVQVALEHFFDLVGTSEPALAPRAREVFLALGAAEAREDRGPEALLAALRTASRVLLRTAAEALAEVGVVDTAALIDLSDAISAYVDELAAVSTDGFTLQLREQAGERERRSRQLAELVLRGSAAASVVLSTAAGIGWRTLEILVPVLLPLDQARDARFRFGQDGIVAERERDAVLLLRGGPRSTRRQLTESLGRRGAIVGPALSWTQMPAAVRLAELTAELAGGGPGPHFTDDYLAALALRGEPSALPILSARRLAPLAHLRPSQRESLLTTLHTWLLHWGSRSDVSAELFIHPQTVSYRLKRLRELLGDDLDDPTARFELLVVLSARGPTDHDV